MLPLAAADEEISIHIQSVLSASSVKSSFIPIRLVIFGLTQALSV